MRMIKVPREEAPLWMTMRGVRGQGQDPGQDHIARSQHAADLGQGQPPGHGRDRGQGQLQGRGQGANLSPDLAQGRLQEGPAAPVALALPPALALVLVLALVPSQHPALPQVVLAQHLQPARTGQQGLQDQVGPAGGVAAALPAAPQPPHGTPALSHAPQTPAPALTLTSFAFCVWEVKLVFVITFFLFIFLYFDLMTRFG